MRRWGLGLLLLGAISWLAKMAVIVATDGRIDSTGVAAVFFIGGVVFMVVGATVVGLWLTTGLALWVRSVLVVLSFLSFFISFVVLDGIAKATLGGVGPDYMRDEAGILVTALVWLLIAVVFILWRPDGSSDPDRPQAA